MLGNSPAIVGPEGYMYGYCFREIILRVAKADRRLTVSKCIRNDALRLDVRENVIHSIRTVEPCASLCNWN